jgi:hypothetical protein
MAFQPPGTCSHCGVNFHDSYPLGLRIGRIEWVQSIRVAGRYDHMPNPGATAAFCQDNRMVGTPLM